LIQNKQGCCVWSQAVPSYAPHYLPYLFLRRPHAFASGTNFGVQHRFLYARIASRNFRGIQVNTLPIRNEKEPLMLDSSFLIFSASKKKISKKIISELLAAF